MNEFMSWCRHLLVVVRAECACRREILFNDYSQGLNIRRDTYKTGQLFILL